MPNHKREHPLTDDERKARNRQYQNARRHKTNNGYARAYRRTSQRAIRWFQENKIAIWEKWLEEELAVPNSKPFSHNGAVGSKGANAKACDHPSRHISGFMTQCDICGDFLGAVPLPDGEFDRINSQYEITD